MPIHRLPRNVSCHPGDKQSHSTKSYFPFGLLALPKSRLQKESHHPTRLWTFSWAFNSHWFLVGSKKKNKQRLTTEKTRQIQTAARKMSTKKQTSKTRLLGQLFHPPPPDHCGFVWSPFFTVTYRHDMAWPYQLRTQILPWKNTDCQACSWY